VGAWLYSGAGGIVLDESHPGYKHFILRPQFTPRLKFVRATLDSPYGLIVSHWHTAKDLLYYDVTVPPNTSAELEPPVGPQNLRPKVAGSASTTSVRLAAGNYHFSFPRRLLK
jgi:alpha-L-rhamnosidase